MAKFYGKVGYAITKETSPGVWTEEFVEVPYYGDVINISRRLQDGEGLNDNIVVSNKISIVSDPYANQNFHNMRYVDWMGVSWTITNVEVQRPRLILTIGEVYNG